MLPLATIQLQLFDLFWPEKMSPKSPYAIAEELGERLRRARLNANMTQIELATRAGLSRKAVTGAEKGKAQLITVIAIMDALELVDQLALFLPEQPFSPIQLAKLRGKIRQRASSGPRSSGQNDTADW